MARKKPKNWLDQRLTILTEILNEDVNKDWTVREIEQAMRLNPLVAKFQPNYGKSTAYRDLAIINEELSKKRTELAEGYIASQLIVTEELIEDLRREYFELDDDPILETEDKIKAKTSIAKAINSLLGRQASILPINIPKKVQVDTSHSITIESFLELRQKAYDQLDDPTVVDGYYDTIE